jgi:membrane fusion protein, copper/silver efflux system
MNRSLKYVILVLLLAGAGFLLREPLYKWFTGRTLTDPHAAHTVGAATLCPELSGEALIRLKEAMAAYEEVRAALAGDRLAAAADPARRLAKALDQAQDLVEEDPFREALAEGEGAADRLARARGLGKARDEFSAVSEVLVRMASCEPRLAAGWNLFECPMEEGFNRWMQTSTEAENPYMGTAMLACAVDAQWELPEAAAHEGHVDGDVSHYTCPMHPSVRQSGPGSCPICGMDLVPVSKEAATSGDVVLDAGRQQLLGVRTGLVEVRAVETEIRAVGRVAFDERRIEDVTVKYGGYIERLAVEETGQTVRRGQTLFSLYSPELYVAQREYLLALESRKAAQGTAAPDRADYLVAAARQKLRLWDISDGQIREIEKSGEPIRALAVTSPASGYVVEKDVFQGASVMPGMRLFRIAALDRVWVEAEVYESELPRVKPGQKAEVTLPYSPGESFRGRVSRILPSLNPESRTGTVRIELANRRSGGELVMRPDMYVDVLLTAPERQAVMVPADAVLYTGPRKLVFLDLGDGRFRQREVKLGAQSRTDSGTYYEVFEGLQPGDRIVTSGNFLVDAEARLRGGGTAEGEGGASHAGH